MDFNTWNPWKDRNKTENKRENRNPAPNLAATD